MNATNIPPCGAGSVTRKNSVNPPATAEPTTAAGMTRSGSAAANGMAPYKAAFTFGIAMIDAGNYAPHAAIMAGGMAPPLGIALATTFFKHKFSKRDREAGITCYFMGAAFVTEGAIPFAAADPLRVIPAAVVGSAVAGGLTEFFRVTLPAPHGGSRYRK